jgi:hypothetical protein
MIDKARILEGRKAVESYRTAHAQLYTGGWHRGIPEEHTPLLERMLADLKEQDFASLSEFFAASGELNIHELGLEGKELTKTDKEALKGMWH